VGSDNSNLKANKAQPPWNSLKARVQFSAESRCIFKAQPLLIANPQAALPMLKMLGRTQLAIDDLPGRFLRQSFE